MIYIIIYICIFWFGTNSIRTVYFALKVNASDDRSSSTIGAKILDVVQMNSVSADSRPKCLVGVFSYFMF